MAAKNYATQFIVLLPKDPKKVNELAALISQKLGPEYQALSWRQTMAGLVQGMELDSIFGYISLGVLFLVIFFVIMIYTLLTVMVRIREIDILRALGTTPGQIFIMLGLESLILAMVSVVGGGLSYYFHLHPIALSAGYEEQFRQYGLAASVLPTSFMPIIIVRDMLVMFVLSILAILYPIFKVNGYRPVEAIHHV